METIELAEREVADGSESMALAADVAERLQRRIPIVYGGGPVSSTVAFRWKTQINENAKVPAWNSSLPELNHNEITGWESLPDITSEHLGVVMLRDESDHDRVSKRADFTRRLTESAVPWVAEIESRGRSTLARLVSLTIVGDLVSTLLADRLGVDPVPVATIEELKKLLAEE